MVGLILRKIEEPLVAEDKDLQRWKNKKIVFPTFIETGIVSNAMHECPEMLQYVHFFEVDDDVPRYNGEDLSGKRVLLTRMGGAGDLIMISPSIRKLKKMYPDCEITLVTQDKYEGIGRMLRCFDRVGAFPIPYEQYLQFDYYISYEKTIEHPRDESRQTHGIDLFAKYTHVKLDPDEKKPELTISMRAEMIVDKMLKQIGVKPGEKIITWQFISSNINRTYDRMKNLSAITSIINMPDTRIFIVGGKHKVTNPKDPTKIKEMPDCPVVFYENHEEKKIHPRIHNLCGSIKWQETAALVQRSDLVVAPDSALVHIAGALDVPCVAIYGPFPPEIRIKYYDSVHAVTAKAPCAPCFAHGNFPCSKMAEDKISPPCWDYLDPEIVVDAAKHLLGERTEDDKHTQDSS